MGQKGNPIGFRIAVNHDWRSRWFADKRKFGEFLAEDLKIREIVTSFVKAIKPKDEKRALKGGTDGGIADIRIERSGNRVRVVIETSRPGIVVGENGANTTKLKAVLSKMTKKDVIVEISEIRDPDANATLIAESICRQIVARMQLKRILKRAKQTAMEMGVDGIKILVSGRIDGAELKRVMWTKEGRVPLHTIRANIDYGFREADTTAGKIGVKVWVCKPDNYTVKTIRKDNRNRRPSHAAHA